jgi:membrane-associated protease RseP (regulator of RpoE activity)
MTLLSPLKMVVGGLGSFLVRRLWPITIAICAVFAARTAASLVEAEVLVSPAIASTQPVKPQPAPPQKAKLDGEILADRNIFCSECVREKTGGYSASYSGQPAVLIATSMADAGARATLRVIPTDVQGSWGLEEKVPGVGKITRIGGTSIDVEDDNGHTKKLSLLDVAGPAGAATPGAGPATITTAPNQFEDRIRKVGENTYEVERSVVRDLVGNATAQQGVRIMPLMEKGEIKGVRFSGVRPTSVAAALGIKSGDTFSAIDGKPIKVQQQLLDMYSELDRTDKIELQGMRAGKPLAITLKFR